MRGGVDGAAGDREPVRVESLRIGLPIFFAFSVVVAIVGGRRLPARSAAWTWAVSLPIAVLPVICLMAGVALLSDSVPLGLALVGLGLLFLAIWVVMTRRSIAKVQAARTDGEVAAALDAPVVEMSLAWAGLLLLAGLMAVIVILAYGVSSRAA
jgi:hypothetical protein